MAIGPRLDLRQTQTLVMTPQLQQAIKLLQLSNLELSTYVEQELERNPLLELADDPARDDAAPEDRHDDEAPGKSEANSGLEDAPALDNVDLADTAATAARAETSLDLDYDNTFTGDTALDATVDASAGLNAQIRGSGGTRSDNPDFNLDNTLASAPSLREVLHEQVRMAFADPKEALIGAELVEMLDDAGYLPDNLDTLAQRLGCDAVSVEAVLAKAQTFEPSGVFARSLAECLGLQLKERNRLDPAMQALLDNLNLLADNELAELRRRCGIDNEDLIEMIGEIRALNPKPGQVFGNDPVATLVPDVFVRRAPDGTWVVELNSETLPRVLINTRYYATVNSRARSSEDKTFINECLHSANWLVKSLNQRANTVLKVSTELVRQQDGFLEHGIQHLKPLNLRAIAEAIGMHESTVSRVTSNKYMATPRGVFELKYFFTTAIASSEGGDSHSSEAVRHRIRELIENETPRDALSDDRIVELLRKMGIDIARRTVAKYRESLKIPSSVQRRRRARAHA